MRDSSTASGISLSSATTFDPLLTVRLATPGTLTVQNASQLVGSVVAGCVAASGKVTVSDGV